MTDCKARFGKVNVFVATSSSFPFKLKFWCIIVYWIVRPSIIYFVVLLSQKYRGIRWSNSMPREKGRALLPRHKLSYQRTRALDLFVLDTDGQSNLLIILCVNGGGIICRFLSCKYLSPFVIPMVFLNNKLSFKRLHLYTKINCFPHLSEPSCHTWSMEAHCYPVSFPNTSTDLLRSTNVIRSFLGCCPEINILFEKKNCNQQICRNALQ